MGKQCLRKWKREMDLCNVTDNRPLLSYDSGSSRSTSSTNSFISEIDDQDSDLDIEDSQSEIGRASCRERV